MFLSLRPIMLIYNSNLLQSVLLFILSLLIVIDLGLENRDNSAYFIFLINIHILLFNLLTLEKVKFSRLKRLCFAVFSLILDVARYIVTSTYFQTPLYLHLFNIFIISIISVLLLLIFFEKGLKEKIVFEKKAILLESSGVDEDCSICLDKLTNDVVSTECNHLFHKSCIEKWIQTNRSTIIKNCPNCRTVFIS